MASLSRSRPRSATNVEAILIASSGNCFSETNDDDPVVTETVARYHADARPTIVVIDSDGKIVKKYDGVVSAEVLGPVLRAVH